MFTPPTPSASIASESPSNISSTKITTMSEAQFGGYEINKNVIAVVVGSDFDISHYRLCEAILYIQSGCKFIASNKDRFSGLSHRKVPTNGPIVKLIETATGIEATLMGKPSTLLFDLIRREHELEENELSEFLMVGDNLETDGKFGSLNRIDTLCVLSGVAC